MQFLYDHWITIAVSLLLIGLYFGLEPFVMWVYDTIRYIRNSNGDKHE